MARSKKLKKVRIGIFGMHRGLSYLKALKRIKNVTIVAVCEMKDSEIERMKDFLPEETAV